MLLITCVTGSGCTFWHRFKCRFPWITALALLPCRQSWTKDLLASSWNNGSKIALHSAWRSRIAHLSLEFSHFCEARSISEPHHHDAKVEAQKLFNTWNSMMQAFREAGGNYAIAIKTSCCQRQQHMNSKDWNGDSFACTSPCSPLITRRRARKVHVAKVDSIVRLDNQAALIGHHQNECSASTLIGWSVLDTCFACL